MTNPYTDNPSDEWSRGDRRGMHWERTARHGFERTARRLRRLPPVAWWMFAAGVLLGLILG